MYMYMCRYKLQRNSLNTAGGLNSLQKATDAQSAEQAYDHTFFYMCGKRIEGHNNGVEDWAKVFKSLLAVFHIVCPICS